MCYWRSVLKATGEFHACPLAIENPAPHFRLGDLSTPAHELFANYRQFRTWATTVLDPAAQARQMTSCAMCQQHIATLPEYRTPMSGAFGLLRRVARWAIVTGSWHCLVPCQRVDDTTSSHQLYSHGARKRRSRPPAPLCQMRATPDHLG